jgi:glyoxylase-like metal-dependent hydrolase (beta-lactamase superfamily II)
MIDMFSQRSPQNKELLASVVLRPPDVIFDQEATIDHGGVTARLLWFGGAHTKGDELTFVEPDRTLISGDVVQNKTMPNIFGDWRHTCELACRAGKGSRPQRRTCLARP